MHWVKVAETVVVTRGLSPLLLNDQVMVTVMCLPPRIKAAALIEQV